MTPISKALAYIRRNRHILLALFYPAFVIAFFALEAHIPSPEDCVIIHAPLDDRIPFLEVFVIPYILWYPYLALTPITLLALREREGFKKHLLFMIISFAAAFAICILVPNAQLLRPEAMPRRNLLTEIVAAIYRADTPTNVFPSMHVIGSIAGAAACLNCERLRPWREIWIIPAILISASTVFIKQHSILDVCGAVIICIPIWAGIYGRRKRK